MILPDNWLVQTTFRSKRSVLMIWVNQMLKRGDIVQLEDYANPPGNWAVVKVGTMTNISILEEKYGNRRNFMRKIAKNCG